MSGGEEPSGARTFAACACAALVAGSSAAVTVWWELSGALGLLALALAFALPIAAAHALVIGLPLYLALRE